MSISDVLRRLESTWGQPRPAQHGGQATFFKLRCAVTWGAATVPESIRLPEGLSEFWASASGARLFVDEDYGQWGLILHEPVHARAATERLHLERQRDHRNGDLVVGEFKGDSDLLLVRCDPSDDDFGSVLVVPPLDSRDEWEVVAPNLRVFVEALEVEQGQKFWE